MTVSEPPSGSAAVDGGARCADTARERQDPPLGTTPLTFRWLLIEHRIPPWTLVWMPVILLPVCLTTAGVSWFLASIGVFIRDVGHAVVLATQVLFFATPIFYSIERVQGSMFDDRMIGNGGDNRFEGLGGNDFFNGKGGWDQIRFDNRDWIGGVQGVKVNMAQGTARDAWGNTDTFTNIEEISGSDYDDVIRDDNGNNWLSGNDGDDKLYFGGGDDGAEGGAGADTFIFRGDSFGNNHIADFEDGIDRIRIMNAPNFAALTITTDPNGANIEWNGNVIGLAGVDPADLTADDFVF